MTFPPNTVALRVISTLLCTTSLFACGGGGTTTPDSVQAGIKGSSTATSPVTVLTPFTPAVTPASPVAPVVTPTGTLAVVTDVRLQNTGTAAQSSVPITFGQVFAVGDVKPTDVIVGRLEDNSLVALQMDVKAKHPDGSVRHAIFSAVIPSLAASTTRTMALAKNATVTNGTVPQPADLLADGFTASVSANVAGVKYSASADELIKAGVKATWLAGSIANEWHVSTPLKTAAGVAHPHLAARFAIRYYAGVKKTRVDVTVENNWAYEPGPTNIVYDAEVLVGGKAAYQKAGLNHYHHARWRKMFWYGGDAPVVNLQMNTRYLIASKAVPNYDSSLIIAEGVLSTWKNTFTGARAEPMGVGLALPYMPTTGGREDIGLMPSWYAGWLLSGDQRARDVVLGTADLSGSWPSHYRDRDTDRPVSIMDHPAMTLLGRDTDTYNPYTGVKEAFPPCGGNCDTPNYPDTAHQAAFAYLPYLATGDYYYLEELQFWAMWNALRDNPNYRKWEKGLVAPDQVRGQAWSLRTLAEAAYITPDTDVLKPALNSILNSNLTWYNDTYVTGASNSMGVLTNGYALSYQNSTAIAPWQDDFFTSSIGHVAELGFAKAIPVLKWKAKFPISRMTDPATCWIDAALYNFVVKPAPNTAVFSTFAEGWKASHTAAFNAMACNSQAMATNLGVRIGEMTGYSNSTAGYPSNMQPALAYAVDSGAASGLSAWTLFQSRTVKPVYENSPQFAIIPR